MMTAQLRTELAEIAQMAYGHGSREAEKGGEGRIGMIGSRVVKFNTNWRERCSGPRASAAMRASCNALRTHLLDIAHRAGVTDAERSAIRKALGLTGKMEAGDCKKLLDRKVVAKVIGMIAGNQANIVWKKAVSKGTVRSTEDMHFAEVEARTGEEIALAKSEANKAAQERESVTKKAIEANRVTDSASISELERKYGVTFGEAQLEAIVRAMNDPKVPFLMPTHGEHSHSLLTALAKGEIGKDDTDVKDALAIINRTEGARRADVIALALVAGPRVISWIFRNDCVMNDLFALKGENGGVIDTELLKKWADKIISDFENRFPFAPPIDTDKYKSENATWSDRLDTAFKLRLFLMIDKHGKGDMLKYAERNLNIDLDAWKNGPDVADDDIFDKFYVNANCRSLYVLGLEFNDETIVENWGSVGNGAVLTKEAIPSGYGPLIKDLLPEDVMKQVKGDVARTEIKATFKMPKGESRTIQTYSASEKIDPQEKAEELAAQLKSFLGIEGKDAGKYNLQERMALGMCCQWSMGFLKSFVSEHEPRQMEFSRDGEDVLVHVKNLEDQATESAVKFDYTIRIAPDGKNSFETLNVKSALGKPLEVSEETPLFKKTFDLYARNLEHFAQLEKEKNPESDEIGSFLKSADELAKMRGETVKPDVHDFLRASFDNYDRQSAASFFVESLLREVGYPIPKDDDKKFVEKNDKFTALKGRVVEFLRRQEAMDLGAFVAGLKAQLGRDDNAADKLRKMSDDALKTALVKCMVTMTPNGVTEACQRLGVFSAEEKFTYTRQGDKTYTSGNVPHGQFLIQHKGPVETAHKLMGLSVSSLTVQGSGDEKPRTLSTVNRFGSKDASPADYKALAVQTFLANPELWSIAQNGDVIEVPIYRFDLSPDNGKFRLPLDKDFSETVEFLNANNQKTTVTLKPTVVYLQIPMDSFEGDGRYTYDVDEKNHKYTGTPLPTVLGADQVEALHETIEKLTEEASEAELDDVTKEEVSQLAEQLVKYRDHLRRTHFANGKWSDIKYSKTIGHEMFRVGARLALLASKLGHVPSINCNYGRDRTGAMDNEIKMLALQLAEGQKLADIRQHDEKSGDRDKKLRSELLVKNGENDLARQIRGGYPVNTNQSTSGVMNFGVLFDNQFLSQN